MGRTKESREALLRAEAVNVVAGTAGIGVDIIEISRMETVLTRTPTFATKYFTNAECDFCMSRGKPAMHFAARFAAKEAVVKALGCGFAHGVAPIDVEILRPSGERPEVCLHGAAADYAAQNDITDVEVSLSHSQTQAVAFAMAISGSAMPHVQDDAPKTSAQQLDAQFKEARSMLDDI